MIAIGVQRIRIWVSSCATYSEDDTDGGQIGLRVWILISQIAFVKFPFQGSSLFSLLFSSIKNCFENGLTTITCTVLWIENIPGSYNQNCFRSSRLSSLLMLTLTKGKHNIIFKDYSNLHAEKSRPLYIPNIISSCLFLVAPR